MLVSLCTGLLGTTAPSSLSSALY